MWRPLITGADRERVARAIHQMAAVVDAIKPRDASDHADRAVLRAHLARGEIVDDPEDASGAALAQAVAALTRSRHLDALFGGTAGIGWTVALLAGGEVAQLVCGRVDAALERAVDDDARHYDLIAGITGFGVYALARGAVGKSLASRVVRALARRARPRPVGLAWHTPSALLPPAHREHAPAGYWNLGVAHGTPGVVGFFARCIRADVERELATQLLEGSVAFLHAIGGEREGGRFDAWIAGAADGAETDSTPASALAWCYHDLGVALVLLSAGIAADNARWRDDALVLARDCARRPDVAARIRGASVCHGAAGAGHMFLRLHHATGDALFAEAARRWFECTLAMDPPLAEAATAEAAAPKRLDPSLLSGAAGVALALHAAITDVEPVWDSALLVDLPR
jgi:lantibiotic biosynthesis protein